MVFLCFVVGKLFLGTFADAEQIVFRREVAAVGTASVGEFTVPKGTQGLHLGGEGVALRGVGGMF